jgi:acyl-CoA synthetase (AMP-forming)/AMP-acid ligase II
VVAVIEAPSSGRPNEAELRAACVESLAKYKVPERFVFVQAFERNSMGKIQRAPLNRLFEGAG